MDDLALFAHALDGTRAFGRLVGLSRGSEVHELEGVTATLVPRCPERSVVNSVSYDDADALAAALDELAGIYAAAGVSRWTVWVPQQDRGAAELLERAGHVLDAEPAAMGLDLGSLPDLPAEPPEWERAEDAAAIGPLNDAAYGYEGSFTRALDGVPTGALDVWVARDEGRPRHVPDDARSQRRRPSRDVGGHGTRGARTRAGLGTAGHSSRRRA